MAQTRKRGRALSVPQDRKSTGGAKTQERKSTVRWRKKHKRGRVLTVPQERKSSGYAKNTREVEYHQFSSSLVVLVHQYSSSLV